MPDSTWLEIELKQAIPIPLDVRMSCSKGELLALIGPSGSGKTTVLRSIAGLYQPASGKIVAHGTRWLDTQRNINVPPHLRRTGLVFQNYALFPHRTALGNVVTALGHLPRRDRRERAHELLSIVGLSGLEDRLPSALSGGQQQRVAFARALAREPHVLLLDEPFSAVDRRTRRQLYAELEVLRKRIETPILLVTHDIAEATRLADRLCVIEQGETLQTGKPSEVVAAPRDARVAAALDLD